MNILLVCDYFLDYLGGAQSAIAAQAAALRTAGHRVTLIAPSRRPGAGDHVFYSPVVLPGLDMAIVSNSRRTRRRLLEILRAESIDVVHVHSEFGLAAAAIDVATAAGIPTVHTVHTFYWRSGMRSSRLVAWLMRAFHRRVTGWPAASDTHGQTPSLCANAIDNAMRGMTLTAARRAGTVVSPSTHQADDLRTAGAAGVVAIPNCVMDAAQSSTSRPVSAIPGALRVLWIGRFIPEKRVEEFAEAAVLATRILGQGQLNVTFAGFGPLLGSVRRLAAHSPDVLVLGRVANPAIPALLADHHVSALTSLGYDNQPMTVAESLDALRGVIYVDDRLHEGLSMAGLLVTDPSVEGMAAALVGLAENPAPIVAASARAMLARELFSPESHARALQAVYRGAVSTTETVSTERAT